MKERNKMKKGKITKLLLGVSVSAFMLSGCTKNVKDEQMSVKVLNESVDGTYTGKVEKKEAEGTGKFILGNKSVVEGKFHEGKFLQGTLTNYDYHFKWVPGKDEKYEFDGKFSGKVKKKNLTGKGYTCLEKKEKKDILAIQDNGKMVFQMEKVIYNVLMKKGKNILMTDNGKMVWKTEKE